MTPVDVVLVAYPDPFRLLEAKALVESVTGWRVAKTFTQKYLNHSTYGMGSGKADELAEYLKHEAQGVKNVVVDEHLTSKQIFNLEKLLEVKVIDRERLILDIFYSRATTNEAKLQIQLAEVKYEMPRVREIAKMSTGTERAGKGGSGEYVVDVKFRDLKRRMEFIKAKLEEAKHKRDLYQQQRTKSGMYVVSLVGYTSAGKTTLFNLLTMEQKQTAASLFTTLSTVTRTLRKDADDVEREGDNSHNMPKILVTDTVGFISRLPTYMIDAFKSTLEESLQADLILLLVDLSEELEDIRVKFLSCWDILRELKVDSDKVQVVLSKYDQSDDQKIDLLTSDLQLKSPVVVISAKTGYGIRKLRTMMRQHARASK